MAGYNKLHATPEDNSKSNTIKQIKELMFIYFAAMSLGIKKVATFDPSKGGRGIRFIIVRITFIISIIYKNDCIAAPNPASKLGNILIRRIPNPETKASNKFAIGPAKETRGMSNFGFLKFL
jgi:hypothetical protein